MKYHKSSEVWKRCRAVLRPGQGVELCPLDGKSHALGRQGIAERGGGIEERTSNGEQVHIKISAIEGGLYTVKSPKGFTRVYRADGTLLSLRERSRLTKLIEAAQEKEEVEAMIDLSAMSYEERQEVAEDPNTPVELLAELANDEYKNVRETVAKNESTPVEALIKLANDEDKWVGLWAASNKSIPAETLTKFAESDSPQLIVGASQNLSTPKETLTKLADSELWDVRFRVADNPNTPVETLTKLVDGKDSIHIVERAAVNPNTSTEALLKLAGDRNQTMRDLIFKRGSVPVEVLEKLSKDKAFMIRWSVAKNKNTPNEILTTLANDKNKKVSERAAKALRDRS